jgi:rubrerythrin
LEVLFHLRELGEIKDTAENLKAAIAGENYEVTTMYPAMMEDAKLEDMKKALTSFTWAFEVKKSMRRSIARRWRRWSKTARK